MVDKKEIIKNLNPADGVDISTVLPDIIPKYYYIFKSGGPHFFSKCKNKEMVDELKKQNKLMTDMIKAQKETPAPEIRLDGRKISETVGENFYEIGNGIQI